MPNTNNLPTVFETDELEIRGLITDEGMQKTLEANSLFGWNIYLSRFAVSDRVILGRELTTNPPNPTEVAKKTSGDIDSDTIWYSSGGFAQPIFISPREIRVSCLIPPGSNPAATPGNPYKDVAEIYIYAKSNNAQIAPNGDFIPPDTPSSLPLDVQDPVNFQIDNLVSYLNKEGLSQFKSGDDIDLVLTRKRLHPDYFDNDLGEWNGELIGRNTINGTIFYYDSDINAARRIILPTTLQRPKGFSVAIYNLSSIDTINVGFGEGTNRELALQPGGMIVLIVQDNGNFGYVFYHKERFNDWYNLIYSTEEFLYAIVVPRPGKSALQYANSTSFSVNPHFKFSSPAFDTNVFQFRYSAAHEILHHNHDPMAHAEIRSKFLNSEWIVNPYLFKIINKNTFEIQGDVTDIYQNNTRLKFEFAGQNRTIPRYAKVLSSEYFQENSNGKIKDFTRIAINQTFLTQEIGAIYYPMYMKPSSQTSYEQNNWIDTSDVRLGDWFPITPDTLGEWVIIAGENGERTFEWVPKPGGEDRLQERLNEIESEKRSTFGFIENIDGSSTLNIPKTPTFDNITFRNLTPTRVPFVHTDKTLTDRVEFHYALGATTDGQEATNQLNVPQIRSSVTTGVQPILVSSRTEVTNLNAERWGDLVRRDYIDDDNPLRKRDTPEFDGLRVSGNNILPTQPNLVDIGAIDKSFKNIYAIKYFGDVEGNVKGDVTGNLQGLASNATHASYADKWTNKRTFNFFGYNPAGTAINPTTTATADVDGSDIKYEFDLKDLYVNKAKSADKTTGILSFGAGLNNPGNFDGSINRNLSVNIGSVTVPSNSSGVVAPHYHYHAWGVGIPAQPAISGLQFSGTSIKSNYEKIYDNRQTDSSHKAIRLTTGSNRVYSHIFCWYNGANVNNLVLSFSNTQPKHSNGTLLNSNFNYEDLEALVDAIPILRDGGAGKMWTIEVPTVSNSTTSLWLHCTGGYIIYALKV
jgi:hypothetical protein